VEHLQANNKRLRLERLDRDKHSSLLRKFVSYGQKKFYNIAQGHTDVLHMEILGLDGRNALAGNTTGGSITVLLASCGPV
jgi:hypothetical protein